MKLNFKLMAFAVFSLATFAGCNVPDNDTRVFSTYLKASFNIEIPQKKSFIILGDRACGGCADYIFELAKGKKDGYTFILPRHYRAEFDSRFPDVLVDTTSNLSKLKFRKGNVAKVRIVDGKVFSVRAYEPFEIATITDE